MSPSAVLSSVTLLGVCVAACNGAPTEERAPSTAEAVTYCPAYPSVLSSGRLVAIDHGSAYIATTDTIITCPTSDCSSPTLVASGPWFVDHMAVDAANVYFATIGAVMACPKSGCGSDAAVIAAGRKNVTALAADGANVYWADAGTGEVLACPASGCTGAPAVLASNQGWVVGIAADGANVYWASSQAIMKCAATGCGQRPTQLATTPQALVNTGLTVDAVNVYWTSSDGAGVNGAVMKVPIGGGPATPLAGGQPLPNAIASDGDYVYWSNLNESPSLRGIVRCAVAGGAPAPLFTGGRSVLSPAPVAVDGTSVYFVDDAVEQLAKTPCTPLPQVPPPPRHCGTPSQCCVQGGGTWDGRHCN